MDAVSQRPARSSSQPGGAPTLAVGMAHILAQMTDAIEVVDPMLTLEGLRLIYHLNRQE